MSETKEKILQTSLYLFALDGYEAVSVNNIADELDISKGALYKHYKNKRDIFNSIIERMQNIKKEMSENFRIPEKRLEESLDTYRFNVYEKVKENALSSFKFWTNDPFARDFRRMIMLEQFRNPEMNDLYQEFMVKGPVNQLINIFTLLQKGYPEKLAYDFYSKVYLLISMSDSAEENFKAEELLSEQIKEFGESHNLIKRTEVQRKGLLQRAVELNG